MTSAVLEALIAEFKKGLEAGTSTSLSVGKGKLYAYPNESQAKDKKNQLFKLVYVENTNGVD